jgi:carboxypeptidase family protein
MVRRIMASLMGFSLALAATTAYCASIAGTITNNDGKPVQGLRVTVLDKNGTVMGSAVSGANGKYTIEGLKDDTYRFALDTKMTNYQPGEPVVGIVTSKGLTLNWVVSTTARPLALAQPGLTGAIAGNSFGMTTLAWSGLVTGVVGGGVVGGLAASGGLGGSVASPSK